MALSIKDAETDALVRGLAARENLAITRAIKLAVNNEPVRDGKANPARASRLAAIRSIQRRTAARPPLITAAGIDAWMHDENGMPL
jgi:hypothetical protein